MDNFCYLCFMFDMLSCQFIEALWPPAGKGLTSCHFPMLCPRSGVALYCIDS